MPDGPFVDDPARPPARPTLRDLFDAGAPTALLGGGAPRRLLGGLAVAAVALVGAVVLWPRPASPDPELVLPRASVTSSPPGAPPVATEGATTTLASLVVDVVGEVRQPGVRQVAPGARIADVVQAAGGLTPRADRARINLAAPVADGERVFVPAVGQVVPPVAVGGVVGGVAGSTGVTGPGGAAATTAPVNLNTASLAELDSLPGVGPSTAQAIIDHRAENGPFRTVDDLLDVRGIGDAKLADLRDRVVV